MSVRSAGVGWLAVLIASAAITGCGSLGYPESHAYRSAQQQLAEAKRDPAVRQYGGVFLRDAEATLDRARSARGDRAQVEHLAYLAQRKVEIAQSITGLQVASANLQALAEKSVAGDSNPPKSANRTATAYSKPGRGASKPKSSKSLPQETAATAGMDGSIGAALEHAAARRDPRSAVITVSGIETTNDRAHLAPDAQRSLSPLVAYLRDNQDSRIIIEGYSDGRGSHEDDLTQSLGVAEAARTYLTGKGIDGARIFTLGRGANGIAGGAEAVAMEQPGGRIEIGLFRGVADPSPALTSQAPPPTRPAP